MQSELLKKLKSFIDRTENPDAENIKVELDYCDLTHLYSLEKSHITYLEAMDEQMNNSFEKAEKIYEK